MDIPGRIFIKGTRASCQMMKLPEYCIAWTLEAWLQTISKKSPDNPSKPSHWLNAWLTLFIDLRWFSPFSFPSATLSNPLLELMFICRVLHFQSRRSQTCPAKTPMAEQGQGVLIQDLSPAKCWKGLRIDWSSVTFGKPLCLFVIIMSYIIIMPS